MSLADWYEEASKRNPTTAERLQKLSTDTIAFYIDLVLDTLVKLDSSDPALTRKQRALLNKALANLGSIASG